jgi:hypothetical protein
MDFPSAPALPPVEDFPAFPAREIGKTRVDTLVCCVWDTFSTLVEKNEIERQNTWRMKFARTIDLFKGFERCYSKRKMVVVGRKEWTRSAAPFSPVYMERE